MGQPSRKVLGRRATHRKSAPPRGHASVAFFAAVTVAAAAMLAFKLGRPPPAPAGPVQAPIRYLGVYEAGAPLSYADINVFAGVVGRTPNLVAYYSGWGEQFQTSFAETALSHGAKTIVQIDPTVPLAKIASGKYDSYLTSFAKSVAAFRHPVVISFGHEMNGFWEPWGYHHTPAAVFKDAWRHIVNLFRMHGAQNVIWLWQVNSLSRKTGPVQDWWPGAKYVNWVGISGYYYLPGETFHYIFGPVVADVRRFTRDPVLIAETGVGPFPGQVAGIQDLFKGIRAQHDLGLVWFDVNKPGPLYKGGNWRLEGHPLALAAFREALNGTQG